MFYLSFQVHHYVFCCHWLPLKRNVHRHTDCRNVFLERIISISTRSPSYISSVCPVFGRTDRHKPISLNDPGRVPFSLYCWCSELGVKRIKLSGDWFEWLPTSPLSLFLFNSTKQEPSQTTPPPKRHVDFGRERAIFHTGALRSTSLHPHIIRATLEKNPAEKRGKKHTICGPLMSHPNRPFLKKDMSTWLSWDTAKMGMIVTKNTWKM
jgi:hypothetical protein